MSSDKSLTTFSNKHSLTKAIWDKMKADLDRPTLWGKFMGKDNAICTKPQTSAKTEAK